MTQPTRRYRFLQLDVFTSTALGGNQLAVFPDGAGLTDTEMQAITQEMNFSETTFVLPASDPKALARVRIFTPATEVPLAGHPVVGTTFALAHEGRLRSDESPAYLELGVGTLPVDTLYDEQRLSFVWMHQPVPTFEAWQGDRARLAAALGVTPDDFAADLPIERGSAGVPFVYIPFGSLAAVQRVRPSADLLAALDDPSPHIGVYVFTLEGLAGGLSVQGRAVDMRSASAGSVDVHGRMFGVGMGIAEDAATGAAAGPLGVYLLRHGRSTPDETGETYARLEQGIEMGRPSCLHIATTSQAGVVRDVRVGGEAVLVAEGELLLPEGE